MFLFNSIRDELLRARYNSLRHDVPVAILTALSAIVIQMIALKDMVDWKLSIFLPGIRLMVVSGLFLYWFCHRDDQPSISVIRWRLRAASLVLVLGGVLAFNRSVYLYGLTDHYGHYFMIFHTTLYGLCFAFILNKIGPAAYIYNLLLIASAMVCIFLGHIEYQYTLAALILMFDIGMLFAMKGSTHVFDRLVSATHETGKLLEENQRLANQDTLTRLPNRRHFFVNVEQQLAQAKANATEFALGIVDLDNFKPVNDAYGHHIGDLVLVEVAERLSRIRPYAIQFYRLGGDEFAFHLLPGNHAASLEEIGDEINQAIAQPIKIESLIIMSRASIGACKLSNTKDTAQSLYEHADFALYHVKRAGRGYMEIFSDNLEEERQYLSQVDQALRAADIQQEIVAAFQPIMDMHSGQIDAFESLARWHSPLLGNVPPSTFIAVAESMGMIADITRRMFTQSIAAMQHWPRHIKLSFNLSAYDMTSTAMVQSLLQLLADSQLHASRFVFEITETALLQDFATVRKNIELIREAGASVALDDFGTGYSSLSHVQNLPLDKLKIDRSFIRDIETNSASQTIVRSILALCQGMHIECVAEGAETQSQVQFLRDMGCQFVQGYFYAKPMAEAAIHAYIAGIAGGRYSSEGHIATTPHTTRPDTLHNTKAL